MTFQYGDKLLAKLLNDDVVLVDVRTNHEFAGFHLPNACNICLDTITAQLNRVKNWHKPVIVYSTYGRRSQLMYNLLREHGIEVYDGVSQKRILRLMNQGNFNRA